MTIYDRHKVESHPGISEVAVIANSSGGSANYPWSVAAWNSKETWGQSIPHFHRKIRNGDLLPHTDFRQVTIHEPDYKTRNFKIVRTSNGTWVELTNHDPIINAFVTVPYHAADTSGASAEMQRAAANIYSQGFDALTFGAELHKTRGMVETFIERFRRLSTNKGRLRSAKELYRLWLEGRYGWRQLAFDGQDLYDAVYELDTKRKIWQERSGFSYWDEDTIVSSGHSSTNHYSYTITTVYRTQHSIRGSVTALMDISRFSANPVTTAWELIPLSFVVDWVYSVGNAINASSLVLFSNGIASSVGHRSETTVDQTFKYTADAGYYFEYDDASSSYFRGGCVEEVRSPLGLSLTPKLSRRLLRPDQWLDLTAIAQAKALF